jgi:hypothetical protein
MYLVKKINATCTFNFGPQVDILDPFCQSYLVEYYENLGNDWSLVHSWHDVNPYQYYRYARKFRTKWKVKIWGWENDAPVLVLEHLYCEDGQKVAFAFDHFSYSVNREWARKAIEFRNKTRCHLIISSRFWKRLAEEFCNERVTFVPDLQQEQDLYATYQIKRHDIQTTTANWWESDIIYENHSKAYKSWYIPIDWVSISNEEIFNAIVGDE